MKLVSGIVDSGFFAQSALSAEVATKDSLGRNISETYLTGVDIPESANWNSTYNTVHDNSASWTGGGATGDFELSAGSGISIVDYPLEQKTVISVTAQGGNPEVEQAVIDNSATWNSVTAKQNELTFGYKDTAISSIDNSALYDNSAHARITTLAGRISDLSSNKLDTTAFSDVSSTFLTAHQDLSDYQTTAGMTAYQPVGDYYSASNPSGFITGVDLTPYQTVEGMTAYQPVGSYLTADALDNVSGNWNEVSAKVDSSAIGVAQIGSTNLVSAISGMRLSAMYAGHSDWASNATKATRDSEGNIITATYMTAVPDTYLQNTDLSTEDGKVTAISGIPLSAGGDVPEGVMVESGLEYNAVNEISGYNGSAIAQYGAEKQWLVHDDTLVHAANSAQYALGVNLSAVAQLLGVDETVLWENTTSAYTKDIAWPQSLTENINGFTKVKFLYAGADSYKPKYSEFDATEGEYELTDFYQQPNYTGYMFIRFGRFILSGTNFTNTNNMTINCVNNQNWSDLSNIGWNKVFKIIGIGRKQ